MVEREALFAVSDEDTVGFEPGMTKGWDEEAAGNGGFVASVGAAAVAVGLVKENVKLLPNALAVSTETGGCAAWLEDDGQEGASVEELAAALGLLCDTIGADELLGAACNDTAVLSVDDEAAPEKSLNEPEGCESVTTLLEDVGWEPAPPMVVTSTTTNIETAAALVESVP